MADAVVSNPGANKPGFPTRVVGFYNGVMTELKRVTWPDRDQTIDATWRIIVFVLFLGLIIFVMDWLLQRILVQWIPSLFGG